MINTEHNQENKSINHVHVNVVKSSHKRGELCAMQHRQYSSSLAFFKGTYLALFTKKVKKITTEITTLIKYIREHERYI